MDTLQQAIYEQRSLEIQQRKLDEQFAEWKARQDSQLLSRISAVIASAWEIGRIIATLSPGQTITINSDGEIFKGRVNTEKMAKLSQKVAKRIPSNMDDAQATYKNFVSKSVAEPAVVAGLKKQWHSMVKKAQNTREFPVLNLFVDMYQQIEEKNPEKIHCDIIRDSRGQDTVITYVDGINVRICTNFYGRLVWYEGPDKIRHEV